MTSAPTTHASSIVPMALLSLNYGKAVCAGIGSERFGRRPEGVDCNTPAWVIGHLSIYPDRVLELIGRADMAQLKDERYETLFANGTASPDDPDGLHYPPMDEIIERFVSRSEAAIEGIAGADEAVFLAQNPAEGRFKQMCPTVGSAAGFLMCSHTMMHLGQLSTWRRCMGLGSAM